MHMQGQVNFTFSLVPANETDIYAQFDMVGTSADGWVQRIVSARASLIS